MINTNNNIFIDIDATTEITAGKRDLALQMLELFLAELPEFKQNLISADKINDRETIGKIIHKFMGSCAICIAPTIKTQLDNLSDAYEAEISTLSEHITKLNNAIDSTIEFCEQSNLTREQR